VLFGLDSGSNSSAPALTSNPSITQKRKKCCLIIWYIASYV
jgi:hypothetical protein